MAFHTDQNLDSFPVDLAFAVDGSDSLSSSDFNKIRQFVKATIDRFPVSKRDVHVALLEYSDRIDLKFGFLAHTNKPELLRAVDRVTPSGGRGIQTDQVLAEANQLFTPEAGARPGVPKMLVIITDDVSTGTRPLSLVAEPLKKAGVQVYVVGVGSRVIPEDWRGVVSSERDVINVDTPGQTLTVVDDIERKIRRIAEPSKLMSWRGLCRTLNYISTTRVVVE